MKKTRAKSHSLVQKGTNSDSRGPTEVIQGYTFLLESAWLKLQSLLARSFGNSEAQTENIHII